MRETSTAGSEVCCWRCCRRRMHTGTRSLAATQEYLKTVKGFKIEEAFPDIKSNPYHWRVDPYEPNRVWFTVRTTATHTGPLRFGMRTYKATSERL